MKHVSDILSPYAILHGSPGSLGLCVRTCVGLRGSRARRFPRQGRAAPAGQAGGAAARRDIAAVTAARGGVGGGSGHHKARGAPTLQDNVIMIITCGKI